MLDYLWHFRGKIISRKKKIMQKYSNRKDYLNMTVMDNTQMNATNLLISRIFEREKPMKDNIEE